MQKNFTGCLLPGRKDRKFPKILRVMRLTAFLLTATIVHAYANGYGQTVTLSVNKADINTVFSAVEVQTGYVFLRTKDLDLPKDHDISITVVDMPLRKFLDTILQRCSLDYLIQDRTIVLSRKEAPSAMSPASQPVHMSVAPPVSGQILDESGNPIAGASIRTIDRSIGKATDEKGRFTLSGVGEGAVLVISAVGHAPLSIRLVNGRFRAVAGAANDPQADASGEAPARSALLDDAPGSLIIRLARSSTALDEMIVIGYGSTRKSDLTGAVSSVRSDVIGKLGTISLEQALQGRAAGVNVIQNSGVPGAGATIQVRGVNSLTGSDPLYVIDGIAVDNSSISSGALNSSDARNISPLSMINPNDIASIEILKDASATAIYGSRGANGVVLVTTKSGKEGKGKVSLDADYGVSSLRKMVDLLNTNEYLLLSSEAYVNAGLGENYRSSLLDSAGKGLVPGHDWQKAIFRQGIAQNYNLNIQGGNKDTRYFVSGNYNKVKGIILRSDFSRYSVRGNLDANVKPWLKAGTRFTFSSISTSEVNTSTSYNTSRGMNSVVMRAFAAPPYLDPYAEDGSVSLDPYGLDAYSPLVAIYANNYNNSSSSLLGNAFSTITFARNFHFKTSVSYQQRNTNIRFYQNSDMLPPEFSVGGWARTNDSYVKMFMIENTLSYSQKFKKHQVNALAGQSWQTIRSESVGTSNMGFPNDVLGIYGVASAATNEPDDITYTDSKLASFFGRLNYSFDNKYLLTLTGRVDGSSKFAVNNKYAFFPAAALAYKLSEEKFMNALPFVSSAKLRVSYGITGNQSLRPYQSLAQLAAGTVGTGTGTGTEALTAIYYPNNIPNNNLKWETTGQLDAGLDASFFSDRLNISADYYDKHTHDLLVVGYRVSSISGFSTATVNLGHMATKGMDLSLDVKLISTKALSWNAGLVFSTGKTRIISLGGTDYVPSGYNQGWLPSGTQRLIAGDELGAFYGYKRTGITQFSDFKEFYDGNGKLRSLDDILSFYSPTNTYTPIDPDYPTNIKARPGEQMYEDLNGDKLINENDWKVIGRVQPSYTYGFRTDLAYKHFDLSLFFDGRKGGQIANVNNFQLLSFSGAQQLGMVRQRWTPEHASTVFPRLDQSNYGNSGFRFSDRFLESATFFRIQNITLGYTFHKIARQALSSCRVYISLSNVMTFSKYTGYTPDVSLTGSSNLSLGHDNATYPLPTTVRFGCNINF
jgi:TonB-linked SusC/RagA family outer membrane protein